MIAYHKPTKQSMILGLIFIFGALIRIFPVFAKSVWFDEYLTLQIVKLPWMDIVQGNYFGDSHPPLYYLTLKLISLFSITEITYRLVAWLFSVASIPLAYILGSKITTPYISLIYSFLVATNTSFIFYATEIRQYAFLIFLVLFALTATTYTTKTWKILGLLSMTAATYTHFFGIFTLLMCAAIAVASNRLQNMKIIAIAFIISTPVIYYYLRITQVSYYPIQYQADPRMGLDIISYALNIWGNVQLTPSLVLDLFQIQNIIGLFFFVLGFICYYQGGLKKVFLNLLSVYYIYIYWLLELSQPTECIFMEGISFLVLFLEY